MAVNGLPLEVRQQLWKQWWDDVISQLMVDAEANTKNESTTEDAA